MYGYPEQFIPLPETGAASTGPASVLGSGAPADDQARGTKVPGEVTA
jgi:hypothetical protein